MGGACGCQSGLFFPSVRLDDKGVPMNGHGSKPMNLHEFTIVYRMLLNKYPFTSYFRLGMARVPGL